MGIFRDKPIEWDGKEYTLVPSLNMLRRIESGSPAKEIPPLSVSKLVATAISGEPHIPLMAHVVEVVMHHAGADDFTEDEFYYEMMVGDRAAAVALWHAIVAAISPAPKEAKKPAAPDKK